MQHSDERTPERDLVAAVIAQAFRDLHCKVRRPGHYFSAVAHSRMAEAWIDSAAKDPWSFIWCCDQVELDPDIIRRSGKRHFRWQGGAD